MVASNTGLLGVENRKKAVPYTASWNVCRQKLGPAATRTRGLSQTVLGFTLSELNEY
jgi:hypothetical protein